MIHKKIIKIYAIGGVSLFFTLALLSASVTRAEDEHPITIQPWTDFRRVQIELLTVDENDPFFGIHSVTMNRGHDTVTFTVKHVLIYPDGHREGLSWQTVTVDPNHGLEFWIDCMYNTNLYGKFICVVTVRDNFGVLLDTDLVSWIR